MISHTRYKQTLADLRRSCWKLRSVDVVGNDKTEELVGRNHLGEIAVRVKGRVTPAKAQQFRNLYEYAVAKGLIKGENTSA